MGWCGAGRKPDLLAGAWAQRRHAAHLGVACGASMQGHASHMPASMPGRLLKFTAEGSRAISDNFCPGIGCRLAGVLVQSRDAVQSPRFFHFLLAGFLTAVTW